MAKKGQTFNNYPREIKGGILRKYFEEYISAIALLCPLRRYRKRYVHFLNWRISCTPIGVLFYLYNSRF